MAKNTAIFSFLMMILVLFDVTMATQIYRVGDYVGWNNSTKVDYSKWSASKFFQVGDFLMFEFNPSNDNVFRVSAEDFAGCRAPSPIGLPSNGQEFYPLDRPGRWYFVCSVPGHCESGQKLEVVVHSTAASAPSPPPSFSPTNLPPAVIMAPTPQPPSKNNPPAASSPASGKLSPEESPSNSPADQKSASVAVSVNFWLAMVAVSFYVCSIA